ncbi:hypothetical protein MPSEU_000907800 [Mayamaea pseudoterrestris]|nr:hypothetical protein MPSEU_000907800 [Mayamaea pseudoterrestris]
MKEAEATKSTSRCSPSRCYQDTNVLQSLLNELSFCEPAAAAATSEDQDEMNTHTLGRSKSGLFSSNSSNSSNHSEEEIDERRSANGSDDESSSTDSSLCLSQTVWKSATDPVSGRIYYYDSISRITQWEKPDEIRRIERHQRKQQKKELQKFFREMEHNIRESLDRGEFIPGVASDESLSGGTPQEPLLQSVDTSPLPPHDALRIRTISCMNEKLLAQVQTADNILPKVQTDSEQQPTQGPASNNKTALVEGRPPLAQRRPSQATAEESVAAAAATTTLADSATGIEDLSIPSSPTDASDALRGESLLLEDSSSSLEGSFSNTQLAPLAHVRRNTGGTIYVQTTMDNPDVQATIKAICGVYRAHILQSAARKSQRSPVSVASVGLDVFCDDYEPHHSQHHGKHANTHHQYHRVNPGSYLNGPVTMSKTDKATISKDPQVPLLEEIELFYQDFYRRSQMEHDTIIMSLIYVERLIKSTNGVLTPGVHNWRSILFSCMVLSSKVWDDLSMYNIDFSQVSRLSGTGLSSFSLQRTNALELAVLTSLNFDVRVSAGEYAKYYFLIRTMLTRSGMLVGPLSPLTKSHSRNLESKTLQYQDLILGSGQRERRTRSVDWGSLSTVDDPAAEIPVLKDTLCLEQLVSMYR